MARIGIAALFLAFGALASCESGVLTGVGPRQSQAAQTAKLSASSDSTSQPTNDNDECYLIDGQWFCPW